METLITLTIFILFLTWRELSFSRERKDLIDRLTKQQQDSLDRIMAKDLREVKSAQAEPKIAAATTRRENEKRIIEQARRVDG